MTADSRFDRDLTAVLEDLYLGPSPDYRDEALATAVHSRQRPSWTFPGRWLPMFEIAVRPVAAPRLPLRVIAVALIVISLLVAGLIVVGSRPRLPAPFGPARNGNITWALNGDIWVGNPADATARAVVTTDDIDRNPSFSRDGAHLAFLRQVPTETGKFDLVVTLADGTSAIDLTPVPVSIPDAVEWAPDSRSLLVNEPDGKLTRFFLDGSAPKLVMQGVHIEPDAFRPPDGAQLLYERDDDLGAVYVMNADGSLPTQLFGPRTAPCACTFVGPARWSPDGRMVAFSVDPDGLQQRMYVMNADGTGFRRVIDEDGRWVENGAAWSPDSTRLVFNRWHALENGDWPVQPVVVVDVATAKMTPIGVAPTAEGALMEWAPDGHSILSLPGTLAEAFTWSPNADGTVARPTLLDLSDDTPRQLDWSVGSIASWQRLAP